jgi:outer membrane protein
VRGERLFRVMLACTALVVGLSSRGLAREMSLGDCVAEALELNPGIRDARETLAQAKSGISEARAGFLPSLSLSGSYNFAEKTQEVSFPDPATGQMQSFRLDFTSDYSFQLGLQQPVYSGGRLTGSYNIAKLSRDIADRDLERRQSEVALQVTEAFYGLLLARESVRVADLSIETAEEFLRVVRARYETGEASSFEVMRAEVEVSNLKPVLINARNGVSLTELALKNIMGVDATADIDFVGSFEREDLAITLEDAIDTAVASRPEIGIAKIQGEIAEQSVRLAKAGRLPTFALSGSYDFRSDDLSVGGSEWEKTYAGYLVMSLPLFDGLKTKSQISRSLSQVSQAEIGLSNLKDAIELEVRSSILGIEASLETLRSQEKNVGMAAEGLEIANERYLQGYATNLEVMDAQLALTLARNNRIQALHDLNVAIANLKKAMGTILKDYKSGARS